jgi:hypothetical protein
MWCRVKSKLRLLVHRSHFADSLRSLLIFCSHLSLATHCRTLAARADWVEGIRRLCPVAQKKAKDLAVVVQIGLASTRVCNRGYGETVALKLTHDFCIDLHWRALLGIHRYISVVQTLSLNDAGSLAVILQPAFFPFR